ncbi:alpha/beta hydrolase [Ferrimonas gelatinilytica]|uniref:Alpha/beta hydrolase n=1 Tax=Ferrimonas gelatinilytica TaxID=1255257 RepID=A0ABP9S454_9GAMM
MSVIPMISSRQGFYQPSWQSKMDRIRAVDLIDSRPTHTLLMSRETLARQIQGKHLVLLIHGYNNSYRRVCAAYQRIIDLMAQANVEHDAVVGYLWPGGDKELGYWSARSRARRISRRMGDQLAFLTAHAARVDIMAHSMGCYLALRGLQKARLSDPAKLGNLYLMAAAVKRNRLSDARGFALPAQRARGIYIFHSKEDEVLRFAFFIAAGGEKALGYSGPKPFDTLVSNARVIDCTAADFDHGSYSKRKVTFEFIAANQAPVTTAQRHTLKDD